MSDVSEERPQRNVARGAAWALSQSVLTRLLSFAVFALLGRLLEPQAFGLVALSQIVIDLMTLFVNAGATAFLVQRDEVDEACRSTVFWSCTATSVVLCVLIWLTSDLGAQLLGEPELGGVVAWLALLLPLSAASAPQQGLLARSFDFKALALRSTVAAILGGVAGIAAAYQGWGAYALVAQQLVTAGVGTLALWAATRWKPQLRWSREVYREQVVYGRSIVGSGLLRALNLRMDALMVGGLLGIEALGVYSVARRILDLGTRTLSKPIESVAMSVLAREKHSSEGLERVYHRSLIGITAFTAAPFAGLAALAPDVVPLLLGPRWSEAIPPLAVLCGSGLFIAPNYINGALLRAVGKPNILLRIQIVLMLPYVPLLYGLAAWGPVGVATAYLLSHVLGHPINMIALGRATGISMKPWLARAPRVFVSALLMTVAVALVRTALVEVVHPVLRVITGVLVGAAVYGASMLLLCREELLDLRRFVGDIRRSRTRA